MDNYINLQNVTMYYILAALGATILAVYWLKRGKNQPQIWAIT